MKQMLEHSKHSEHRDFTVLTEIFLTWVLPHLEYRRNITVIAPKSGLTALYIG